MANELATLQARVARLEAAEACRSAFNEYLYYLDGGLVEDLLGVFDADAQLEVMNFPPGSGQDLTYSGRDEMRTLYAAFAGEGTRHHAANVSLSVAEDASRVDLSAYFLTAIPFGLTGGIYEASLAPVDGRWRITSLRIASTWGWSIPQEAPPFLAEPLAAGTLRGGRPAGSGPGVRR
jgi:hypothetical protein